MLVVKVLPQLKEHLKDLDSWSSLCLLRVPFWEKAFWQTGHT